MQRAERVDVRVADGLGRLERAAAGEDREAREQLLARRSSSRSWLQAIVARSVRCRSGASRAPPVSSGSRCSSRSSSVAGGSTLHARRGQLDRQRQAVEPRADRRDESDGRRRARAPRALGEQRHRLGS